MTLDEQLEDLYGPLAPYSDFKKNDHITYRSEGQTCTGTILWVATATRIAGRDIPIQYIVEPDYRDGIPDSVWQSDIVMDPQEYQAEDEPAMVKCPYCGDFTIPIWWSNARTIRTGEGLDIPLFFWYH